MEFSKKGQLSMFIIMGVIVLIIVLVYLVITPTPDTAQVKKGFDNSDIDALIKSCIEAELDNGLYLLGYQGGYINIPENVETIDIVVSQVPYWLKDKQPMSLTDEFVGLELEQYLKEEFGACIQESNTRFNIELQGFRPSVLVYEDSVIVDMDVDLIFRAGDVEKRTGRFAIARTVQLGSILNTAQAIVSDLMDGIEQITGYGFMIISYNQGDEGHVYSIVDNSSIVRGSAYQFSFGIEKPSAENTPPILDRMNVIRADVGERVYVDYNAVDDHGENQLTYSMMSMNIPGIDVVTGEIDFVPDHTGLYQALVTVTDGYGEQDYDTLIIEVGS